MSHRHGLVVIDLQFGFSPDADLVEGIRDAARDYAVVVATRFCSLPDSLFRHRLEDGHDGGAVIDIGHSLIIDKPGYGLDQSAITALREFEVDEWGLVGSRTGACIIACAFSLWDAGIPFHVLHELCAAEDRSLRDATETILQRQFAACRGGLDVRVS
ncbi:hypothetical protein [Acidithiobacillus sp.]|uniref:cysteine hydrolase family protein n=1 Tax=Acidithiobacillus sp. TaxID=1872118 RepID=UPI0025B7D6BA|nr:hypothetical protein [Acidithiobacillus sp.]MCK9187857.1 hypothetical protein [Acidithiobacillus sp.]MCK9358747.1 hypothetical protein [Acidithiobacillus sp.]